LKRQLSLLRVVNESKATLDEFISEDNTSSTACSARLFEAKGTLDGLIEESTSLSTQVASHEQVLETETENLNITDASIAAADAVYQHELSECETAKQAAIKDHNTYTAELEELDQIASAGKARDKEVEAKNGESLLSSAAFDKKGCLAFLDFAKRHNIRLHHKEAEQDDGDDDNAEPAEKNDDDGDDGDDGDEKKAEPCDTQRSQLQEAFTSSYTTVRDLMKSALARSEDTSCVSNAESKNAAARVPLLQAREEASSKIEFSTTSLASLSPVLNLAKERVDSMQKDIDGKLTPECTSAAEVSETLQNVRDLILSLDKCPGRNSFQLNIPEDITPAVAPEAAAAEAVPALNQSLSQKKSVKRASFEEDSPNEEFKDDPPEEAEEEVDDSHDEEEDQQEDSQEDSQDEEE